MKKVFLLTLVGAAVYYGWLQFEQKSPAGTPAVAQPVTPAASGGTPPRAQANTPSETLNQLASLPGNAIQKARDAVAAREGSGQSDLNIFSPEDVPRAKAAERPMPPEALPVMSGTTTTTPVAPGLTATMQIQAADDASPAFRAFVGNAKISGVVPTRAIINGRLVRVGEVVDTALGISFEGYNADSNELLFRDRTGAQVSRRY